MNTSSITAIGASTVLVPRLPGALSAPPRQPGDRLLRRHHSAGLWRELVPHRDDKNGPIVGYGTGFRGVMSMSKYRKAFLIWPAVMVPLAIALAHEWVPLPGSISTDSAGCDPNS